jgi:serine/threonine-protein kinase
VSTGPETVAIPSDLAGRSEVNVTFILGQLGLLFESQQEYSDTVAEGLVIRTEPAAGTIVTVGDSVTVFVSQGPEPVEVPDLTGMTEDQARTAVTQVGLTLTVSAATVEVPPDQDGRVVSQTPAPLALVPLGRSVEVILGKAPPPTTLPSTTPSTTP